MRCKLEGALQIGHKQWAGQNWARKCLFTGSLILLYHLWGTFRFMVKIFIVITSLSTTLETNMWFPRWFSKMLFQTSGLTKSVSNFIFLERIAPLLVLYNIQDLPLLFAPLMTLLLSILSNQILLG